MRPLRSAFSFLLRCTVFLLNAAVFADLASYLAVGGLASVELSCSLTTLVLQARLALIPRLPILAVWSCSRSLSLSLKLVCCRLKICNIVPGDCAAVCSRSASLHLATELLEVGRRHGLDLAASHRLGHLCLPSHLWSHCSFLRHVDLFLELFDITPTSSFQDVRMQISRLLSM